MRREGMAPSTISNVVPSAYVPLAHARKRSVDYQLVIVQTRTYLRPLPGCGLRARQWPAFAVRRMGNRTWVLDYWLYLLLPLVVLFIMGGLLYLDNV